MPLGPGMAQQPGDPPFTLTPVSSYAADGYQVSLVSLGSHTGTHVDAPRHFYPDGLTLDQFPLERLIGRGVVFDCRENAGAGLDELVAQQLDSNAVAQGGLVLLWTEGRLLTVAAAEMLVEAGVGLVGIDAPSVDAEPYPVHRLLLAHDVLIVENLCGLERLGPGPVDCVFLPLALTGTDGAPVRAIAWR